MHDYIEALGPDEGISCIFGDGQVEIATTNTEECIPVVFDMDGDAMRTLIQTLQRERRKAMRR